MRLIDADALERDGWRMSRTVQIDEKTMQLQTRKPTDFPAVEPQPEPEWIPCSERLPEEHGFYLVSVGTPYKHIRVYQYEPCTGYENENLWRGEDGSYCFNWFVEAWRPLPESYKAESEDKK